MGPSGWRALLLCVVLLALLRPALAVAGEASETRPSREGCYQRYVDRDPLVACHVESVATLTVHGCEGDACPFTLHASARGVSETFGLPYVDVIAVFGEDQMVTCIGMKPVSDAHHPLIPCHRVCDRDGIGTEIACEGELSGAFHLPRGSCVHVTVYSSYDYSALETTWTIVEFLACQLSDGSVHLDSIAWNEQDE